MRGWSAATSSGLAGAISMHASKQAGGLRRFPHWRAGIGREEALRMSSEPKGTDAAERAPAGPTKVGRGAWLATLKRTVREFRADNLTDWAAALTYYGVLAIFPALIAMVA